MQLTNEPQPAERVDLPESSGESPAELSRRSAMKAAGSLFVAAPLVGVHALRPANPAAPKLETSLPPLKGELLPGTSFSRAEAVAVVPATSEQPPIFLFGNVCSQRTVGSNGSAVVEHISRVQTQYPLSNGREFVPGDSADNLLGKNAINRRLETDPVGLRLLELIEHHELDEGATVNYKVVFESTFTGPKHSAYARYLVAGLGESDPFENGLVVGVAGKFPTDSGLRSKERSFVVTVADAIYVNNNPSLNAESFRIVDVDPAPWGVVLKMDSKHRSMGGPRTQYAQYYQPVVLNPAYPGALILPSVFDSKTEVEQSRNVVDMVPFTRGLAVSYKEDSGDTTKLRLVECTRRAGYIEPATVNLTEMYGKDATFEIIPAGDNVAVLVKDKGEGGKGTHFKLHLFSVNGKELSEFEIGSFTNLRDPEEVFLETGDYIISGQDATVLRISAGARDVYSKLLEDAMLAFSENYASSVNDRESVLAATSSKIDKAFSDVTGMYLFLVIDNKTGKVTLMSAGQPMLLGEVSLGGAVRNADGSGLKATVRVTRDIPELGYTAQKDLHIDFTPPPGSERNP